MPATYDQAVRAQRAMSTFRIKFSKINRGPSVYAAQIHIDGEFYGQILQRRGGPYEAFTINNRLIASASSLRELREAVSEHYAGAAPSPAA